MALIKCPECGKEASDTANNCPNCGYNIKKHFMKQKVSETTSKLNKNAVKRGLFIAFASVVLVIAVIFVICTVRYYNNPFKRVKANSNYKALVMSYGFPIKDEDWEKKKKDSSLLKHSDKYTWENVSFCGLKGKLIVMTDKKTVRVAWDYDTRRNGEQPFLDKQEKLFDTLRAFIGDDNWNGDEKWSSSEEALEYSNMNGIVITWRMNLD